MLEGAAASAKKSPMSNEPLGARVNRAAMMLVLVLLVAASRFFLSLNLPLLLRPQAVYDDALFMRLAANLASGHWLGSFDQYTLMKGPGYPAFLAVSALSGLPVSVAHASFATVALLIAGWTASRLTCSRLVGFAVFIVLALYPDGFIDPFQLVLRDQIYWAQTLIVVSLFSLLLLRPPRALASQSGLAVAAGIALGWTWLTREEGVWLLPGLGLLMLGTAFMSWRERGSWIVWLRNTAVAATTFLAVNGAFMTGNRIAYGSFVGVDFRQRDFTAAVDALQSVDIGTIVPYVPVPAAARAEVAKISPTFAPIAATLAPGTPVGDRWGYGCQLYQQGCGDISAGWFVWALRDLAAANGYYQSPRVAAEKFGQIAADIAAACAAGKLHCRRTFISFMPAMTEAQWLSLPYSFWLVAEKVAFLDPPTGFDMPAVDHIDRAAFDRYWRFLNYPRVNEEFADHSTTHGWYYDSGSAYWPVFKVYGQNGEEVRSETTRVASPDIAKLFNDPRGANNRWETEFDCPNRCVLETQASNGPKFRLAINDNQPALAAAGTATLYLDGATYARRVSVGQSTAIALRGILARLYGIMAPFLIGAGLLALVAAMVRALISKTPAASRRIFVAALAAWTFVAARIGLIGLMYASSGPVANFKYSAPANYLALLAAILSIASLLPSADDPKRLMAAAASSRADAT